MSLLTIQGTVASSALLLISIYNLTNRLCCICTYICITGTKSDLRHTPEGSKSVKEAAAKALAKKLKLYKYIECSARTQSNLQQVGPQATCIHTSAASNNLAHTIQVQDTLAM